MWSQQGSDLLLGYQHPDTRAKTALTGETISGTEGGKAVRWGSHCFTATVTPWRDGLHARLGQKGEEGGVVVAVG